MVNSSVIVLIFYSLSVGVIGYIFSNQSTDLKKTQKLISPASNKIIVSMLFIFICKRI
jgi:hypothetical protein